MNRTNTSNLRATRKSTGTSGTSVITPNTTHDEANQIASNAEGAVKSLAGGKKWLKEASWVLTDLDETLERMATILFAVSMSPGIDIRNANTIRAIAYTVTDLDASSRTSALDAKIEESLKTAVSAAFHSFEEKLEPQINFLKSVAQATAEKMVELDTTIQNQVSATTHLLELDTRLSATTSSMTNHINSYKDALTNPAPTPAESRHVQPSPPRTTPQSVEDTALRNREATKSKQILITFNPVGDAETAELKVTQAAKWSKVIAETLEAISILPTEPDIPPRLENLKIRGAFTLRNGDLLVEFQETKTAEWFRISSYSVLVLEALGFQAKVKERQFPVMLQFVPVEFDPTSEVTLRDLETANNADPFSLVSARWIKNPSARARGQTTAHLRLMTNSPEAANKLIVESIFILNKKISAKKPSKEPMRCLRCLRFGHEKNACLSIHDACTHCAGPHTYAECNAKHENPRCANCLGGRSDHLSNSRTCPEFRRKCAAMDAKSPDNMIPYYPTSEEWTWAKNFEKLSPYAPSDWPPAKLAKPRRDGRQNFRQTTLHMSPASGSNAIPYNPPQ